MIATAILAGGEGIRIGGAKPDRMLQSRTLLDWALANARCQADRIAVCVREAPRAGALPDDVAVLLDPPALAGPIAGLASALDWACALGAEWLVTLPCDTPFAPRDLAKRLTGAAAKSGAACAVASSEGVLHPACALWRPQLTGALGDYLATGRRSLIGFAEQARCATAGWPNNPYDPFFNVNAPEDLLAAESIAAALP